MPAKTEKDRNENWVNHLRGRLGGAGQETAARGGTLAPALPGETGLRDGQFNRPARYGTMGSVPDSTVTAPGIS